MVNGTTMRKVNLLLRYLPSFVAVKRELGRWRKLSETMPPVLREQAKSSLDSKQFHCLGGAAYLFYPGVRRRSLLKAIVALQTISDYLDNLCDRMEVNDARAFRSLHQSFTDALDPGGGMSDYYAGYPKGEEVYLPALVEACRKEVESMPHYREYREEIMRLASYYCELQVRKHLFPAPALRLKCWIRGTFPEDKLWWNEWAAATGSTLGIFMLMALSYSPPTPKKKKILEVYFPWIQALHILFDYFIDREEDQREGDMNFTFYYRDLKESAARIQYLYRESQERISELAQPAFHGLILDGLVTMYGSDPKLFEQDLGPHLEPMLENHFAAGLYRLGLLLRRINYLT